MMMKGGKGGGEGWEARGRLTKNRGEKGEERERGRKREEEERRLEKGKEN